MEINENWYPKISKLNVMDLNEWKKIANIYDIHDGKYTVCIDDKRILFSTRQVLWTACKIFHHLIPCGVLEHVPNITKVRLDSLEGRLKLFESLAREKIEYDSISNDPVPPTFSVMITPDMQINYMIGSYLMFKSFGNYFTLKFNPFSVDVWYNVEKQLVELISSNYADSGIMLEYSEEMQRRLELCKDILHDMYELDSDQLSALSLITVLGQSRDMVSEYSYRAYMGLLDAIQVE